MSKVKRMQKSGKKIRKKTSNNLPKTRKDIRKEKRNAKKIHRKHYYERNKKKEVGRFVKFPEEDPDSEEYESFEDDDVAESTAGNDKSDAFKSSKFMGLEEDRKREEVLKSDMREKRKSQLLKANEDEDKIIKKLEKQLKLKKNKSGSLPKSFVSDGLDYLLEVCDSRTMSAAVATEKHLADNESESEFEEDLAVATGRRNDGNKNKNDDSFESGEDISDSDIENFGSESDMDADTSENINQISPVDEEETYESHKCTKLKHNKKHEEEFDNEMDMEELEEEEEEEYDESFHSGELSEEELTMLYTGASAFPDGVCRPENLTPIREETESDLDLYKKGVEIAPKSDENASNSSIDNDMGSCVDETLSDTCMDSYPEESEDSDCEGCSSSLCDDESENEQIVVNGKIINTYGRELNPKMEDEDFIRCPELDKILADISDSESENDKVGTETDKNKNVDKKRKTVNKINSDEPLVKKICKSDIGKFVKKIATKTNNIDENEQLSDEEDDFPSEGSEDFEESDSEKIKINDDGTWEDIYGRKRDKNGSILSEQATKYIPPHLRNLNNETESPELTQLKRQIKSLLNKVAGSNMHWISSQLESLYNSNSRNSVNNAFCSLWMSAIVQSITASERMAVEHSALVAILHANVGSEIGAHFLQTLFMKFNEMMKTEQKLENKELDNLVLGLAQLYNFKIYHSSLLYEILDKFVQDLNEKNIECILVVLRNVGGVLRKDDPAALKVFIHNTQEKASHVKNKLTGSRVNFLLDVLLAIKNNNLNKIPNYDPTYSEDLKKCIKAVIRRGNTVVPLNIKLDDLLKADERGRWWIVGSAWDNKTAQGNSDDNKKERDSKQAHLLKLADKLRINTELRRNIFCIIMSAEDYVDAFEKLQHLGLKHQQEREIIHVLIACCLHEKIYNPYYSVLAQRFCDYDRKFQMSIQYTIWDKLKDLDTFEMFQISNLAQFLTHLFIEKGLPISILKVVQFSDLSKPTLRLMRQILLGILLNNDTQNTLEVFQRIAVSPKLHLLRESLRLFISHFLLKNAGKKENVLSKEQEILLNERATAVDRILQSDSKLKF